MVGAVNLVLLASLGSQKLFLVVILYVCQAEPRSCDIGVPLLASLLVTFSFWGTLFF